MLNVIFKTGIDEITVPGLTQWDKGRTLEISMPDAPDTYQVHFAHKGAKEAYVLEASDGKANVPNIILTQRKDVTAWIYIVGDGTGETIRKINLPVTPRTKPADYVYEETEVLSYGTLLKRIQELEEKQEETIQRAVEAYLEENPIEGTTEVPTLLSQLSEDATHRTVTDAEKETWNAKSTVTYDSNTKTLNICSGGGTADVEEIADYVKDVEKIVIDGVEVDLKQYAKAEDVEESIKETIQEAKDSGEFDGKDGNNGTSIFYGVASEGTNPSEHYYIVRHSAISDVKAGDLMINEGDNELWIVKGIDDVGDVWIEDAGFSVKGETGAQGPQGEKGENGADGYTPVKGTDYFTEAEQTALKNEIITSVNTETWTFTLEDGTPVEKKVVLV